MSLFEEPHLEPQPEPEKPKKKKLLSIGIGAALIVAVLVTSVLAFSFGQSGKPSDNIPDAPQQEEIQTPADTDIPPDESTDTEKPEDTTPSDSTQETPSTSGKQNIDPSTGKDKYQTDPVPDGKPAPAEPEDTEVDTSTKYTCTISITCKTILDNMDKVKESKKDIVPSNGIILDTTTVTFSEGESVYDQGISSMVLCKGPVLLFQSRPCPFCDVLFVPVPAVKILSASDLTHRGIPPPCS